MRSPKEAVEHAQQCLTALKNHINALVALAPEVFSEGQSLHTYLQNFNQVAQEATDKLASPTFRIATIGTTSSGKSTAVNALIGRRIAPIDSGEMSAGILTFAHHPHHSRLIIETTHDAEKWPSGTKENLSDVEIYNQLKSLMGHYHAQKKTNPNLTTPSIRVEVPLMPMLRPELLELPTNVQFELIDLPGLKSVNDANLKVIQKIIKEYTFSLVILDYTQAFDEEKSERLFRELKDISDILNKRTDLMMFITNKVDANTSDDRPLAEKLTGLAKDISQKIGSEEPKIIGAIFRLLYPFQCAWGPDQKPLSIDAETRIKLLKDSMECTVCIGVLGKPKGGMPKFEAHAVEMAENGKIPDENFEQLLNWANEKSGGKAVWDELRQRIKTCFPQLVILPCIKGVDKVVESLITATEELANTRKIQTNEGLEKKIQETHRELEKLKGVLNTEGEAFKSRLDNSLKKLQHVTSGFLREWSDLGIKEAWRRDGMEHHEKMQEALSELGVSDKDWKVALLSRLDAEVEKDVYDNLIEPLREAIREKKTTKTFSCSGVSGILLGEMSASYEKLSALFSSDERIAKGEWFVVWFSSPEERERVRMMVEDMMKKMCQAIDQRVQWKLQSLTPQIQDALEFLLKSQKNRIIAEFDGNYRKLVELALSPSQIISERTPKLPNPFVVSRRWWDWGVLKKLPSVDQMANKLLGAVRQANHDKLWPTLISYLKDRWQEIDKQMQAGISHTQNSLDVEFKQQRERLKENADLEIAKWNQVEHHCNGEKPFTERLKGSAGIVVDEKEE